jgi:PadR family transcriptional regulator, regulatory protein AphA
MRELNHTAVVILGMLGGGPKSGYDIKRLVDKSTRFFWSASYGQIYPELRELERAGLVVGEEQGRGGRSRTAYALTEAGREALHAWLASPGEPKHEIRDEGILRLFFSDALEPDEQRANLAAMRARYEGLARRLREDIQPVAAEAPGEFAERTARFGVELYEWLAGWCAREEEALRTGAR